jgi:O-antigen ligase
MSAAEIARDAGALDAAAGVLLFLAPWGTGAAATVRRAFGLGLLVVSWVVLIASLVPSSDVHRFWDRLTSPVGAVAIVVAVALGLAVFLLLVRLALMKPWTWFLMLGLALPVRLPVPIGGESRNLLLPLYVVIAVGIAAWVWGRVSRRFPADGEEKAALDLPIALFVAFTLVSTLWSSDTEEAAVKAVFFYIPFLILYRLVIAWWGRADALRILVATTIGMAVPVALLALGQYAARWTFWNDRLEQANIYSRFFRVNGIFFDPNILGRYLAIAVLAGVGVAWVARRPSTIGIVGVASAICAAGLAVTFSRSSTLGLIVGLVFMACRAFGARRTFAVSGILAIALGAVVIAGSRNVRRAVTSSHRLERVSEGRFDLVKGGLEIWKADPVAGIGLGAFSTRYEQSLTREQRRKVRVIISHNAPVTVLSEVGVIGFALFLYLGVATTMSLARAAGPPPPGRAGGAGSGPDVAGWAAWTALAMTASIFVHSLLYAALFEDPYTWVIAGAGLALGHAVAAGAPPPEPETADPPTAPQPVAAS